MPSSIERIFKSGFTEIGNFNCNFSQDEIKNEIMFFNCDLDFAYKNGGEITRSFIDRLPCDWNNSVLDSRVHMLMPGWYPAIPGYHHDDVARKNEIKTGEHFIKAGQPDYDNMIYKSEHIMGLINGDICPTSFIVGDCKMPEILGDDLIYRVWDKEIKEQLEKGIIKEVKASSGKLIYFDWQSFHSCVKASGSGWRWFCRVSRNTSRQNKITNEIRKQAQVYLEFPMEGW